MTPRDLARALGGDVQRDGALVPGPGHSRRDRSLSVTLSPSAPDGFAVYSQAGDDPLVCKDYVRGRLGLEPFRPKRPDSPPRRPEFFRRQENPAPDAPDPDAQAPIRRA